MLIQCVCGLPYLSDKITVTRNRIPREKLITDSPVIRKCQNKRMEPREEIKYIDLTTGWHADN